LKIGVVIFVLLHELLHIILCHGTRRNGRDPDLWNIACDYAVNGILFLAGVELWENCYHDKRFHRLSAEQIFDILKQEKEEKQKQAMDGMQMPSKGKPGNGQSGEGQGEPSEGEGQGEARAPMQPTGWDILPPATDGTPGSAEKLEQDVAGMVASAAQAARMQGVMPGDMDIIVTDMAATKVNWEQLLREHLRELEQSDQTWTKKNRRFQHIYMPGWDEQPTGHVVFIGDTSGSMYEDYPKLRAGVSEIISDLDPEKITVLWADAAIKRIDVIERGQPIDLHPKGGGGTDMRVPLEYAAELNPHCVVIATDGETPWPDQPPNFPLFVVCTTEKDCPIGHVVRF
jgi:predicted metal-dependent peptidase